MISKRKAERTFAQAVGLLENVLTENLCWPVGRLGLSMGSFSLHKKRCIILRWNLFRNVGFSLNATHTTEQSYEKSKMHHGIGMQEPLQHPERSIVDYKMDKKVFEIHYGHLKVADHFS